MAPCQFFHLLLQQALLCSVLPPLVPSIPSPLLLATTDRSMRCRCWCFSSSSTHSLVRPSDRLFLCPFNRPLHRKEATNERTQERDERANEAHNTVLQYIAQTHRRRQSLQLPPSEAKASVSSLFPPFFGIAVLQREEEKRPAKSHGKRLLCCCTALLLQYVSTYVSTSVRPRKKDGRESVHCVSSFVRSFVRGSVRMPPSPSSSSSRFAPFPPPPPLPHQW